MKRLDEILKGIAHRQIIGDTEKTVGEPSIDSRSIEPEGVFIAIAGTQTDGHKFIDKAIQNGARTVICEQLPQDMSDNVTWIQVADSARSAGQFAHAYFGYPSAKLRLIGITGTNGKTTVATLLHNLLNEINGPCGLISTIECRIGQEVLPSSHTTPDPVTINRLLAMMVEAGCRYACMEVSSHAIDQKRISGLDFAIGIFTNISHDHLDYHKTFKNYLEAKKKFFDELDAQAHAMVNIDDPRGEVMVQNTKAKVSKYSLRKLTDFKAKIISNEIHGLHLKIGEDEMISRLAGEYNAYNLLAVYGAAILLGYQSQEVLTVLSGLHPVEGRFDIVHDQRKAISAIIDYAHTPDALQKILGTLVKVKKPGSSLWVVVGCGGDRDRDKRPKMARIAVSGSDYAVFTSDNPRSEDPDEILEEMMAGVPDEKREAVFKITDRAEAIRIALRMARKGDMVLIAGKGHEKYQEIKGNKIPFDDKEIVRDALSKDT